MRPCSCYFGRNSRPVEAVCGPPQVSVFLLCTSKASKLRTCGGCSSFGLLQQRCAAPCFRCVSIRTFVLVKQLRLRTPPAALRCPLLQMCQYSYFCTSKASTLVHVSSKQVCWRQGGSGSRYIYRTQSAVRVKQVRWYTSAGSSLLEAATDISTGHSLQLHRQERYAAPCPLP